MTATELCRQLLAHADPATLVADALDDHPGAGAFVPPGLLPRTSSRRLCGPAVLLALRPAEPGERLTHDPLLEAASPGSVAVIDAGGHVDGSVVGGRLARLGMAAGVTGYAVSGMVRDLEDLESLGLGVWSAGTHPAGARISLTPEVGVEEVRLHGIPVRSGDLVVADPSGIVVVQSDQANAVLRRALEIAAMEEAHVSVCDAVTRCPAP